MKIKRLSSKERRVMVEDSFEMDQKDFFYMAISHTLGGVCGARQKRTMEKHRHGKAISRLKDVQTEQVITFVTSGGKITIAANALTQTGHIRKGLIPLYNQMKALAKVDGKEYVLTK